MKQLIAIVLYAFATIHLYAQATWTQKSNFLGSARNQATGFSIGYKGYIGTGWDSTARNDFWEYDQATDIWTQKADFGGVARWSATGFSIGTKGYIGMGSAGYFLNDFWEYDPGSNTWTQKAYFSGDARYNAVSFSIGNKGYIGTGDENGYKSDFWEYNQDSDQWSRKADFGGTARTSAVGFSIGNLGYIGTGFDTTFNLKRDFWEYNPTSDIWTQKADFGGVGRSSAIGFCIGSKGYIGIGWDGSEENDFWEYDQGNNTWTQKADFGGLARNSAVGFNIGNKGYIGTGYDINRENDFWEYNPLTDTCQSTSSFWNITACNRYVWNDSTYASSGTDTAYFPSGNLYGCDSTAILNLTINYSDTSMTTITACNSYIWNNDTLIVSGTYVAYFPGGNANGCDSSAYLILTIGYSDASKSTYLTICDGGFFIWHGTTYRTSGNYIYSYTNSSGCPSVDTLHLTVNQSTYNTTTLHECNSYTWNGNTYTSSGTYTSFFPNGNAMGCDSTDTLHLTIYQCNPCNPVPPPPTPIMFQKTFGGIENDYGNSVQQTCDGGYVIAGNTYSLGTDSSCIFLIKTNANGDTLWTKSYGESVPGYGVVNDTGFALKLIPYGYSIAGQIMIFADFNGDTLFTSENYNIDNQYCNFQNAYAIADDGNNYLAIGTGYTYCCDTADLGGNDILLLQNGELTTYGGKKDDEGASVEYTSDGGVVILGTTRSFGADTDNVYLIKTYDGTILWSQIYQSAEKEEGYQIQQVKDGGYIILGRHYSAVNSNLDILLIRTDASGNPIWSKTYGGPEDDIGYSVQQTNDSGYIIVGSTRSYGVGDNDVYLIKTDLNGDTLWCKTYGGSEDDNGYSVQQTSDSGYIIVGSTVSYGLGKNDIYLIKTDANGNSSSSCNERKIPLELSTRTKAAAKPSTSIGHPGSSVTIPPVFSLFIGNSGGTELQVCDTTVYVKEEKFINSLAVYPNPTDGNFYLNMSSSKLKRANLNIYNSIGQNIYSLEISGNTEGKTCQIHFTAPAGIYLIQVNDGEKNFTQKLIIQ